MNNETRGSNAKKGGLRKFTNPRVVIITSDNSDDMHACIEDNQGQLTDYPILYVQFGYDVVTLLLKKQHISLVDAISLKETIKRLAFLRYEKTRYYLKN